MIKAIMKRFCLADVAVLPEDFHSRYRLIAPGDIGVSVPDLGMQTARRMQSVLAVEIQIGHEWWPRLLSAEAEQPQNVNRKIEQVRAALRPSDVFGELSDERSGQFQSVQCLCSQVRVFADAVIRQSRPAAPGIRDHAVARQIETDPDVVNAVLHRA